MSARVKQDRDWVTNWFPDLANVAIDQWRESTPYQKYGMQLPWRTLRRKLDSFSKSQKKLRDRIEAKKAKEGDVYMGGGLDELCLAGASDWYMIVEEVLAGTGKSYAALCPSYTVVVYRNQCPSEPGFRCVVNATDFVCCELRMGSQVGRADTIDDAVDDWKKRIAKWQEENPGFKDWPHPKEDLPPDTVHIFVWKPEN